jgi:uncharacterized protein (TIGR02246 family)
MIRALTGLVVTALLVSACGGPGESTVTTKPRASEATTTVEVRAVLDQYVKAVVDGDEERFREQLADPENVSYVNPLQRLRSRDELHGFFEGFVKNPFTRRDLKLDNVVIQVAGDAAWSVFDWEFNATRTDGQPFQSRGWETQVYRRTNRGWRIAHPHYSVPATPPPTGGSTAQ